MARDSLILDRYEPLGTAGTGGFGTVRIAWDPRIQRKVAIKTIALTELDAYRAKLPGAQAADGPAPVSAAERWRGALPWEDAPAEDDAQASGETTEQEHDDANDPVTSLAHLPGLDEARTAAMLDDPRIVTVYDFEVRDRTAYLIMEFVEGITLTRLLREFSDSITLDMVTAVFDAVSGALMTAHAAGVLHLDIKPDNIIITPQGQSKVTDFGLATLADASGVGTTGGGTIGYMPLEQMRREHLDARTDEWSLAALTYEMLTGSNPFRAATLEEAERAIENAELILPSLCWENLDEQVDDVVFYALDPDREERYASVADFAEEMDKFLGNAALGEEDLSEAVSDSLGLRQDEPEEEEATAQGQGSDASAASRLKAKAAPAGAAMKSVFSGLFAQPDRPPEDDFDDDYDDYEEDEDKPPAQRRRDVRKPHVPLGERYSERTIGVLSHVFAIAASAALAFFAMSNMPFLALIGPAQPIVVLAVVAACAVVAIVRPSVAALVSFCLLGLSFAVCGHPIPAALLVIAAGVWWYAVGHEGMAAANVALLLPIASSIGAAPAVPIIAGAALKPPQALATTAFSALVALMLAALGSGSVAGWDAVAHWSFAGVNLSENLLALIQQPGTWTALAGWMAASAVLSLLNARGGRAATVVGIVAAVAFVVVGVVAFSPVTPQLIISVAAAAVVLLVVLL